MYPPPPSSSSPPPLPPHNSAESTDLSRCDSAVGKTYPPPHHPNVVGHYFVGDSSSFWFDSGNCNVAVDSSNCPSDRGKSVLERSYGINETEEDSSGGASSSSLLRHRSTPPGFVNQQLFSTDLNGFTLGRPSGDHRRSKAEDTNAINAGSNAVSSSCMSFGIDNHHSWDSSSSNIRFTIDLPGKPSKTSDFFTLETQLSMPQTSMEMARMENIMHIPEDSVPCRIRAKRGFATHPRSIAERERRTRISGKLKKLQELVPNMDKQTSYADMLDLAVEHIKGLQHRVETLQKEMDKCTCNACKR